MRTCNCTSCSHQFVSGVRPGLNAQLLSYSYYIPLFSQSQDEFLDYETSRKKQQPYHILSQQCGTIWVGVCVCVRVYALL